MPNGSNTAYTDKQKRQAGHIVRSYRRKGAPLEKARRIAWATVNKQDGGGLKGRSGAARKSKGRRDR